MTAVQTVQEHGFSYLRDCSHCDGKYEIYKNPGFPVIEIHVAKRGGRAKIYRKGQLIAQTIPDSLELVLTQKGL